MPITVVTRNYNPETKQSEEIERTFAHGCVLKTYHASVQVMFDEWAQALHATYWDEEKQQLQTICDVKATADATPEVKEKVKAFLYARAREEAIERLSEQAAEIRKGSVVKVISGRADKGAVGKVVAMIDRPYKMGWKSVMAKKLGIATSDVMIKVPAANGKVYENHKDMVWAWARNVNLVEVPAVPDATIDEVAQNIFNSRLFDWKGVLI